MAPGTEAPAEMHFYFPQLRALCMAENATHNLHNLLTLRGALVRDPHVWAGYLTEAIDTFADRTDVVFASHHWPTWGTRADRRIPVAATRPVRLPARPDPAAAQPGLHRDRDRRDLRDAAGAGEGLAHPRLLRLGQPQRQGDLPALHGLVRRQPRPAVAAPAGSDRRRATSTRSAASTASSSSAQAFDDGDFRWAATLLDHAVFTDENHAAARELYADTLEQLAYGAENGTGATSSSPARPSCATATSARRRRLLAVDPRPAHARAAVRLDRDHGQRPEGVGSRPRRRRHLPRHRRPTTGSRCATACWSTARRPPTHRRRTRPSSWRTSCGCWPLPPATRRARAGGHRRRRRAAVDPGGGGQAGPELQHRHAVAG